MNGRRQALDEKGLFTTEDHGTGKKLLNKKHTEMITDVIYHQRIQWTIECVRVIAGGLCKQYHDCELQRLISDRWSQPIANNGIEL